MKTSHILSFSAAFGLAIASFVMSALLYTSLPENVPTHFGITGAPDAWAPAGIFTIFFVPLIQIGLTLLFLLIYRHPQYMSWPTTMLLMTVEKAKRDKVFEVLRTMTAALTITLGMFFTYLQFVIMATANNRTAGVSPYIMIAFVALILLTIIITNTKVYVVVRKLTKQK